jgi:hypothetical protein
VNGGSSRTLRIAEVIEQRGFIRTDDADDVRNVFGELGQRRPGGEGGFTGERHGRFLVRMVSGE